MPVKRFRKGTYNSYFKRKMSRRGKYGRKRGASFPSRVKRAVLKTAETKMFDIGTENVQLYHNIGANALGFTNAIPNWFDPWSRIAKGTNRWNRIGDRVTPRGIALRLYIANKNDRPCTIHRIMICSLPKTTTGLTGATITTATFDPFEQSQQFSDSQNVLTLFPDKDRGVRVLYDKVHRLVNDANIGNQQVAKEPTKLIKLWIKRRKSRDIVYDSDYSFTNSNPLAVYVIPYEQYSTLVTDNVASIAGTMRLYYKDV